MVSYETIKKSMKNGSQITYILDRDGHMTNIIFNRKGNYSYIDVIRKRGAYAICFYGDYKPLVIQGNWRDMTLDEIPTRNFSYIFEKIDAGEYEEFDVDEFHKEAKEYFAEYENKEELYAIIDRVEYEHERYRCFEELVEVTDDPGVAEGFLDLGMVATPHFMCWMAIIELAQEKMREDMKQWA